MRIVAIALFSTIAACGGDGDAPPTCSVGQVVANGDPGGGGFGTSFTADNYTWLDALGASMGTLDIQMNGTGTPPVLHLEWDEIAGFGDPVPARGYIIDGAGFGNCDAGPLDSELTMEAEAAGGTFVLRHLRQGPPFCGEEISGEIVGCFKDPNP